MHTRPRPLLVLATIAALEGLGLIGYSIAALIESMRDGVSGPEEVSNGPAVGAFVAIQLLFGVGMLWVAWGWWRSARWARGPFFVAQLLGALIGFQLAQGASVAEKVVGCTIVVVGIIGLVVSFMPTVSRAIGPPPSRKV
jgi:hypothetical protein